MKVVQKYKTIQARKAIKIQILTTTWLKVTGIVVKNGTSFIWDVILKPEKQTYSLLW